MVRSFYSLGDLKFKEPVNSKYQNVYKRRINTKTGKSECKIVDKINIIDKINEYADDVKLDNIISKYGLNLKQQLIDNEERLIDLSNMPEDLMQALAIIDGAKGVWNEQSADFKKVFNNNFNEFIAGTENGKLAEVLNKQIKTAPEKFTQITQAQRSALPNQTIVESTTTPVQSTTTTPVQTNSYQNYLNGGVSNV